METRDSSRFHPIILLFFYREKTKLNLSKAQSDVEQLKAIIAEWSVKPADPKKPYLVSTRLLNEHDPKTMELNLILSSEHLVNHLLKTFKRKVLGSDYTYQLSVDQLNAMMMGFINLIGSYCPYGIMLSNRETAGAMQYGLHWTKSQNEGQVCGLMGDASTALSCAVKEVFPEPDTIKLMCFAHMMKAVNSKLAAVRAREKEVSKQIMDDIRVVADHSIDEETLLISLSLMYIKYQERYVYKDGGTKKEVGKFLDYFRNEWTKKRENFRWWQGANPGHVRTNNATERANRSVKEFTHNQRLGLHDLLTKVCFSFLFNTRQDCQSVLVNSCKLPGCAI